MKNSFFINYFLILSNNTNKIDNRPAEITTAGQILYVILAFSFIIFLIYISGMFIKNKNMTLARSKNIEVVEKISIGVANVIAILRCGDEYFLVSITKEKTTLITKLDENSLDFTERKNANFGKLLSNIMNKDTEGKRGQQNEN